MKNLKRALLFTPLGGMVAIADQTTLYLLDFIDNPQLNRKVKRIQKEKQASLEPGKTAITFSIERELSQYFGGILSSFKTAIHLIGTCFQQAVWNQIKNIEIGTTTSYSAVAKELHKASSIRAVANAHGANPLLLIIPCHRVVYIDQATGNYSGGKVRKEWLLSHETVYQKDV